MNSLVIFIINLYTFLLNEYVLITFIKYQKMPPCSTQLLENLDTRNLWVLMKLRYR